MLFWPPSFYLWALFCAIDFPTEYLSVYSKSNLHATDPKSRLLVLLPCTNISFFSLDSLSQLLSPFILLYNLLGLTLRNCWYWAFSTYLSDTFTWFSLIDILESSSNLSFSITRFSHQLDLKTSHSHPLVSVFFLYPLPWFRSSALAWYYSDLLWFLLPVSSPPSHFIAYSSFLLKIKV